MSAKLPESIERFEDSYPAVKLASGFNATKSGPSATRKIRTYQSGFKASLVMATSTLGLPLMRTQNLFPVGTLGDVTRRPQRYLLTIWQAD